ncbi:SDR family NAD(P)-dependent oxidoreductase [Candidatus Phycosocius spiralis]|uniref:Dehydrogenase n=1 Tax=Candidatus Phycosocius spiralis TaxID=2815099 RepID=A0ABQ4PTN2_9PROT|nr:SDR family oxidoreductase [Candidatus Phycosocius spiralis]GIU66382.1 dehydrogenase [Candidatus Phycosocius spiralis]
MARRICLVTGASAGIGQAIARVFAERGYDLALSARREDRLKALAQELNDTWGAQCHTIVADLTDPNAPQRIVQWLYTDGHHVDALVNNAGYGLQGGYLASSWREHAAFMQVMVTAPLELIHLLLPAMQARGFGRIMNVASLAGLLPGVQGATLYGAAKAFLIKTSQALNLENATTGVHVSALCPGFTFTEFHDVNGMRDQVSTLPNWLWQDAKTVAQLGYEGLESNHAIVVSGTANKAIAGLSKLIPDTLALSLMKTQLHKFRRSD